MWLPKEIVGSDQSKNGLVALAIDKDKGSQHALRWATEKLLDRGQALILIHVSHKSSSVSAMSRAASDSDVTSTHKQHLDNIIHNMFISFHCFCSRKDIQCLDVVLEGSDIVRTLTDYVAQSAIETLVLGASSRQRFIRFKSSNIPSSVSKAAPDFCTVYVISKGKISSVRNASRPAPYASPLFSQIENQNNQKVPLSDIQSKYSNNIRAERESVKTRKSIGESFRKRSPFPRGGSVLNARGYTYFSESDTDISFVSSDRTSTDRASSVLFDNIMDSGRTSRVSTSSERSFGSILLGPRIVDLSCSQQDFSPLSTDSARSSVSWQSSQLDDMDSEMRRLKLELKQTIDMYSTACKEALTAKKRAVELQQSRIEEEHQLEEAQLAEGAARSVAEKERVRYKKALETAEASKRSAELEAQRRQHAEMKALKKAEDMKKVLDTLAQSNGRYRRYTIEEIEAATDFFSVERKVGEGGYGPVYKCHLDHTPVAVKVLRPDAAQGKLQFQKEIEILSRIRHPHMVLLLGACPEYGCLVYEYMARGSLDDCIFRRGNNPVLPWKSRFRIAAEIATGLLFLHQTKPEPLVHRDLKPGNILLDYNYVSKIGDVGLARLVPAVSENVTQCLMTSTVGTLCYIDPEYQQTGMLGVKSDVYSLGIVLLQLITAKPPMGLSFHVAQAIENESFQEMLDPTVPDWPIEETLCFAKIAVQCAELRRKDRPDLGNVLQELSRLRDFAGENMNSTSFVGSTTISPHRSRTSTTACSES